MNLQIESRIQGGIDKECPEFWARFNGPPDFDGKSVLEVGCGLGALSIDMAQRGAEHVTGVDILEDDVITATRFTAVKYPQLAAKLQFTNQSIVELENDQFDLIVSKDAFEHIIDVPKMLQQLHMSLANSGQVYIGFSPLYHSPYGDHDRRRAAFRTWGILGRLLSALPWGHLFLEQQILKNHPSLKDRENATMYDLKLNKMTIGKFRQHIKNSDFEATTLLVNRGENMVGKLLSLLRHIPFLESCCTYNAYCILRKAKSLG